MTIIVGIDPGLTGALAWLKLRDDKVVTLLGVEDMPTSKAKSGKTIKAHLILPDLARRIQSGSGLYEASAVVIEDVHAMPGQGVTSMFRFGFVAGAIEGVAVGLGLPVRKFTPQAWMKLARMKQGDDAGRLQASALFPRQSHLFARKMDHNRADAALIGYAALCDLQGGVHLLTA